VVFRWIVCDNKKVTASSLFISGCASQYSKSFYFSSNDLRGALFKYGVIGIVPMNDKVD